MAGICRLGFLTTSRRSPEAWNHGLFQGNHPKMAQHFRLVNDYFIYPDI